VVAGDRPVRSPGRRPEPRPEPPAASTRRWPRVLLLAGGALLAGVLVVLAARWVVRLDVVADFLARYPGQYPPPAGSEAGFPGWVGWQHFLSSLFMLLIVRSGLRVRRQRRPAAYVTPRRPGARKIGIELWFHQALDVLWVANGVVFVVLLFASGHWVRIVPTSWEVIPHAISAGLQYASLDWPTGNGWTGYNSLQQLAYFATVFVASPLAIATGLRMSDLWPRGLAWLDRLYPVSWARALHFPVMLYFVAFTVVHVGLVLATGALRNLNHMYGGRDAVDGVGAAVFAASLVAMALGWIGARPATLIPVARVFGRVSAR
jgi:thiosulfate reductase cytochrome b subunit